MREDVCSCGGSRVKVIMFGIFLEAGVLGLGTTYLVWWRVCARRRRSAAWDNLAAHLEPRGIAGKLDPPRHWNEELYGISEGQLRSISEMQRLWAMYDSAEAMLEMADYAASCDANVDLDSVAALRRDAFQIRVLVAFAVSKYACSQVSESTNAVASRAAAYYADMVQRTAELAQSNCTVLAPGLASSI